MPTCENCGNNYDKAFKVVMAGRSISIALNVLSLPGTDLQSLQMSHHWAWARKRRNLLLLRSLRREGRCKGS